MMALAAELHVPSDFWGVLSQDDQTEFIKLRARLHRGQQSISKDIRMAAHHRELLMVLSYLERSPENMEVRAIISGILFVGPAVCVNTRQLKLLLGRCKSSINGCFKQLGFVAVRTKVKARNFIAHCLTALKDKQDVIRQWTVRCSSSASQFCFLSSFPRDNLPALGPGDLKVADVKPTPIALFGAKNVKSTQLEFDLEDLDVDLDIPTWKGSFSIGDMDRGLDEFDDHDVSEQILRRSESAQFELGGSSLFDFD
jgi:hypothetical protein